MLAIADGAKHDVDGNETWDVTPPFSGGAICTSGENWVQYLSLIYPLKNPARQASDDYDVHADEIRRGDFVTPSLLYDVVASEGHEKVVPAMFCVLLKKRQRFVGDFC